MNRPLFIFTGQGRSGFSLFLIIGMAAQCVWASDNPSEQDYLQDFPVVLSIRPNEI